MARHSYVILSRAHPGREEEFDRWYDERHLHDVLRVPGVVSAQRFQIDWQVARDYDVPNWRSLAIYEIEGDEPLETIKAISALADTEVMPLSDALNKVGMVRLLAAPKISADG